MHRNFLIAAVVVLVVVVAGYFGYSYWKKHHVAGVKAGLKVMGYNVPLVVSTQRQPAHGKRAVRGGRRRPGREGFGGDDDGWPQAGTFGNLADTNPYGNYADSQNMFYPVYYEYAPYWTRS